MLSDDSELFQGSLAAMDAAEGYLGSTSFLDGLLRVMVSDWTDALAAGTATPDMAMQMCEENAAILMGKREGFGAMPGWNVEGGIDLWVASQLGTAERGQDAIENALIQMLTQCTSIVNYAEEPGVLEEQWKWQVDAMFEEYVNLFLGIPGEDPDGPEFGPPDVPSEPLTEGWVTINTGDDDEGGQRVYIDGSGKMQTGKFAGQTMDQAFGKSGKSKADKPAEAPKSEPKAAVDIKSPTIKPAVKEKNGLGIKRFINTPAIVATGKPETVKIADLTATQDYINPDKVAELVDKPSDKKPDVFRQNGKLYVGDGHHRVEAAKLKGGSSIEANVIDVDEVGMPLAMKAKPAATPKAPAPAAKSAIDMKQTTVNGLVSFRATLKGATGDAYGATGEDPYHGVITLRQRPDGNYETHKIETHEDFQRKGIGTALYRQADEYARSQGKVLMVSDELSPDSRALHKKLRDAGVLKGKTFDFGKPADAPDLADHAAASKPKAKAAAKVAAPAPKSIGPTLGVDASQQELKSFGDEYKAALDDFEAEEVLAGAMKAKASQVPKDPGTGFKIPVKGDPHYADYQKLVTYQLAMDAVVGGGSPKYADPKNYEVAVVPISTLQRSQGDADYMNDSSREEAKHIGTWLKSGRPEDYAPILVDASGAIIDGNHRHAARVLAKIPNAAVLRPKPGTYDPADAAPIRTVGGKDAKLKTKDGTTSISNAITNKQVDRAFAEGPESMKNLMDVTDPADRPALQKKFEARGKLKESIALVPSAEQLAAKLSDLSDGLISAAYDQEKGLLIGNFGDWADGETMDAFDAVAREYNLEPVHEDELGDVVAAYPGSVEVDLEAPLTHTQESLKRWSGYP